MKKLLILFSLLALSFSLARAQSPGSLYGRVNQIDTANGEVIIKYKKIDSTNIAPGGSHGQVLTSRGPDSSASWQSVSGGGGDYIANNWFGESSGNHTLSGVRNTGAGLHSGLSLTTAYKNAFYGDSSCFSTNTGAENVAIGTNALKLDDDNDNVAVGCGALENFTRHDNTALGYNALNTATNEFPDVAVGYNAFPYQDGNGNSVAIGADAGHYTPARQDPTSYNIVNFIGYAAGEYAPLNLSNAFISGSVDAPMNDVWFGSGYRMEDSAAASHNGTSFTIHGTGASKGASNKNGGAITIAGGISTGAGHGGKIIFQSSPAGSSGASDNALTELISISDSGALHFTFNSPTQGKVLTATDGAGGTGWAYALNGWIKTDTGSPHTAPSVTAGTKGIAFGDTATASGYQVIAWGNQALADHIGGVALGWQSIEHGLDGVSIGESSECQSAGSLVAGKGAFDGCTVNTYTAPYPTSISWGGYNTLYGAFTSCDNHPFNTCLGYSASAQNGRSELALGDGAFANGTCAISMGSNSGVSDVGVGRNRISIYSTDTIGNSNISRHDSTTIINGLHLQSNNADEYLFGAYNKSASNVILQVGDGSRHGNASTYDCLAVNFDGTVTAGKNFKSTLRTVTNSTDTGTQGEICYDANFIYICISANTWKRIGISTW